jgi:hypothetical protein
MKLIGIVLTVALALSVAVAGASAAPLREFEGKVVSVDRGNRTFKLKDAERGTVRIKVKRSTAFERINGFAGLHAGLKRVEVNARRSHGKWVAASVERSGGGGRHGGDDDRPGDDD